MNAFARGWLWLPCALALAGCAPDAGDRPSPDCAWPDCEPETAGPIPPWGAETGMAAGATGGGAPSRDAGSSGSFSEQLLPAPDGAGGGGEYAGLTCSDCENHCGPSIAFCYEAEMYGACACAELCYGRCFEALGGCGEDPEELEYAIEYAERVIQEYDVACP